MTPREWFDSLPPGAPFTAPDWEREGFIHATAHVGALHRVERRFYAQDLRPYVLLVIDEERLSSEVRWVPVETWAPPFPHVHGPIDRAAIRSALPMLDGPLGMRVFPGLRDPADALRIPHTPDDPAAGRPRALRREDGSLRAVSAPEPPPAGEAPEADLVLDSGAVVRAGTPLGLGALLAGVRASVLPGAEIALAVPSPPFGPASEDAGFAAANAAIGREPGEQVVRFESEGRASPWFAGYWPEPERLRALSADAGWSVDPVRSTAGWLLLTT